MKVNWLEEPQITTGHVSGFELVWLKQTKIWCRCTIKFTILSTKVQTFPTPIPTWRFAPRHMSVQQFYSQLRPWLFQKEGAVIVGYWRYILLGTSLRYRILPKCHSKQTTFTYTNKKHMFTRIITCWLQEPKRYVTAIDSDYPFASIIGKINIKTLLTFDLYY